MIEKVLLKRSDVLVEGEPKLPTSQDMLHGELAINYKKDHETISALNDNNEIATFSSDVQVNEWISSAASAINQTISAHTGNDGIHLPAVTVADNGKVLRVVNGEWTLVTPITVYAGSESPGDSLGNNGDIYTQI